MKNRTRVFRTGRWWVLALVVGAVAAVGAAHAAGDAAADPADTREFAIEHRTPAEAAETIGPLLSEQGSMSIRPAAGRLVVTDRASVLERIAASLERFDQPPREVQVTLTLILGSDRSRDEAGRHAPRSGISREVNGVMESLGDFTKWKAYEPLGSRSITTTEGKRAGTDLSDDYRVEFSVKRVDGDAAQDRIVFDSFKLQRIRLGADGSPVYQDVYATGMVLRSGKLQVIGAASGPDSERALFLTVRAEARK